MIARRVRTGGNRELAPILDTFDLLTLQQMSLRSKMISSAEQGHQARNMTTNKRRRGGKKGKAEKRREHGLIGTMIHH